MLVFIEIRGRGRVWGYIQDPRGGGRQRLEGRKKRMCQQGDGGADWPSGGQEREYLEEKLERGGGDVEHVHGC